MTTDEKAAMHRLYRRATFMHSEAHHSLLMCAAQSGDAEARRLTLAAVKALQALHEYGSEWIVAQMDGGGG